ncbi:hypothetical protein L7F22_059996 [Adiantum nelumboides]|nr:hypothetical protein [Adiantum nelumboides]
MASKRSNRGNDGTETEREPQYQNEETNLDPGRRDTKATLSDASARTSRRLAAERAHKSERDKRDKEDLIDASRRYKTGRDGSIRKKHSYHMERVTKSEYDIGNGAEESDHSRWRMGIGTSTGTVPVDSSEDSSNSENEQDEIEVKMYQGMQQLTIELEDIRQSLPAMAKFIKEKKKQADARTVEVPKIKDDEVSVIQRDYKNRKQWEPLSGVILDGGVGVNIIGDHMKEKMGITNFKPAPFRVQGWRTNIWLQRIVVDESSEDDEPKMFTPIKASPISKRGRGFRVQLLRFQVFDIPTVDDNEVNKANEKDMTMAFGQSQGGRDYYQLSVAPQRRRAQRSPTATKRKTSPHGPPHRESKKEEKDSKKKKDRKRSPSSPSSSSSSSSDESGGYSSKESPRRGHKRSHATWRRSNKLKIFKQGGKSISFLTYDGIFGATDKVLAFIQQFDAAFGDEGFTESSKLCHVAMHFQKSARQWWASLRANGEAPQTWKNLRASNMKQFLSSDATDKVLTKWQSLKLTPFESIHKYVDKFWDLHLKAIIYKKIEFEEQKQQFCAGLPEDMNDYVNSQRPKSFFAVIHHTMVATRINFQQGLKPMETKEKHEHKEKNQPQNSSKGNSSNNKAKEKGVYKGKNRLTPEELEHYRKDNQCFKCGEQGHSY